MYRATRRVGIAPTRFAAEHMPLTPWASLLKVVSPRASAATAPRRMTTPPSAPGAHRQAPAYSVFSAVAAVDPISLALALTFLLVCAAAAALIPAVRASRIPPATALTEAW